MKDDTNPDQRDSRTGDPVDSVATHGIEVDELMDVERIELGSRPSSPIDVLGWETVPSIEETPNPILGDEGDVFDDLEAAIGDTKPMAPVEQVLRLEQEHLQLAAELASLRRSTRARERALESELADARATIEDHEAELGEQVAQIASLTLERDGLRSQLKSEDAIEAATAQPVPPAASDKRDTVARLKERLEERGHAVTLARAEIAALQRECLRLRQALARQRPGAKEVAEQPLDFRANLRHLFRRLRGEGADHAGYEPEDQAEPAEQRAAFAGGPGSEVPTIAMEKLPEPRTAAEAAVRSAVQARMRANVPLEQRSALIDRAVGQATARRRARRPALHRYLIALDPDRDEVHELSGRRVYVGRAPEAGVCLDDATVSRLHGMLTLESGETVVEDASSTNGVFVNAQRVQRAVLNDGDTVAFGTARFQYRVGPPPQNSD